MTNEQGPLNGVGSNESPTTVPTPSPDEQATTEENASNDADDNNVEVSVADVPTESADSAVSEQEQAENVLDGDVEPDAADSEDLFVDPDDDDVEDLEPTSEEAGDAPDGDVARLQAELDTVREEAAALKSRLLRTAADYDNFRKRADKEREELKKYAADKVVLEFLPVMDNLERAVQHSDRTGEDASSGLADGVRMVIRQFGASLEKFGVKGFDSVNEKFDPERHEAVQQVVNEDLATGTIVEEFQRGYFMYERLLRPALVVVARNPNDDA